MIQRYISQSRWSPSSVGPGGLPCHQCRRPALAGEAFLRAARCALKPQWSARSGTALLGACSLGLAVKHGQILGEPGRV